jgi:hypothetical protein
MIMGYACDSDDGNAAVLLITDLTGEADALALCPNCLPVWISVMHHEMNGGVAVGDAVPVDPETGEETDEDADADAKDGRFTPETVDTALADDPITLSDKLPDADQSQASDLEGGRALQVQPDGSVSASA